MERMILLVLAIFSWRGNAQEAFIGCAPTDTPGDLALFPTSAQLSGVVTQDGGFTSVQIAEDFAVTYHNTYKYLVNMRSGQEFILYQCGTAKPEDAAYENMSFFEIPLRSVMTSSSTPMHFVELLGVEEAFSAVDMTYVNSPCFQKRVEQCNTTRHVSSYSSEWGETSADAGTDAVIIDYGTPSGKEILFTATADPGIINRAEWIKFLSVFFNVEAEANRVFSEEVNQVNKYEAEATERAPDVKPLVAWTQYNAPYYNEDYPEWNSDASWQVNMPEYKLEYVQKSGGLPLDAAALNCSGFCGTFATFAEFKEATKGVHIIIDETYPAWPDTYPTYTMQNFKDKFSFTDEEINSGEWPYMSNDKIFRVDKKLNDYEYGAYGTAWFESAISEPNRVLRDLLYVVNPEQFPEYSSLYYFRNLALGENCTFDSAENCAATCPSLAGDYLSLYTPSPPPPSPPSPPPPPPSPPSPPPMEAADAGSDGTFRQMPLLMLFAVSAFGSLI